MKSTSVLLLATTFLFAGRLAAQIPNPGFEEQNVCNVPANWGYIPLSAIIIDSLGNTHSDSIVYDSVPYYTWSSPDAYSGNYSMCIRNAFNVTANEVITGKSDVFEDTTNCSAFFSTFIPIDDNPAALSFYYKFTPAGNDTAYCYAALYDSNGVEIAKAIQYFIQQQTAFTQVEIPFNYSITADAAFYTVNFSNKVVDFYSDHQSHFGTRLYIDDISFIQLNGLENENQMNVTLFPNPVTQSFSIHSDMEISSVRLININGELVKCFNPNDQMYDIADLSPGIYIVQLFSGNNISFKKIIKP